MSESAADENFRQVADVVMPLIRERISDDLHPRATIAINEVADRVIAALRGEP